jgi:hypothetical protein
LRIWKSPFRHKDIYRAKEFDFRTTELFIDILLCQWVGTGGTLKWEIIHIPILLMKYTMLIYRAGDFNLNSCLLKNIELRVQVNSFIRRVTHTNIKHCWLTYLHTRNFGPLSKTQFIYWTIFMTYTTLANIIQWYWSNIASCKHKYSHAWNTLFMSKLFQRSTYTFLYL